MAKRIAYLGPPGTNSEEAAARYDPAAIRLPFPSVTAVADAVQSGMAEEGVVAIENSIEGSVNDTLDLLIHEAPLFIRWELVVPIEHCLLVKPGAHAPDVKVIYSHPQALGQCRRFLARTFPTAQLVASLSTAAAVEQVLASKTPAAAIASRRAADLYPVELLARGIQDNPYNVTRFVVLAHEDHGQTGSDKTSLCLSFAEDKPGQLYKAVGAFALRGINLAKIESRPAKDALGRYIFLVDVEGHRNDPLVREALEELKGYVSMLKVFGSYPKYKNSV
ncbi:MAG: prephenate dehydratase [Dehalococcoidia bacterium]|nr:prephenate dehydratase [Dehalococcoidia bacterium]